MLDRNWGHLTYLPITEGCITFMKSKGNVFNNLVIFLKIYVFAKKKCW